MLALAPAVPLCCWYVGRAGACWLVHGLQPWELPPALQGAAPPALISMCESGMGLLNLRCAGVDARRQRRCHPAASLLHVLSAVGCSSSPHATAPALTPPCRQIFEACLARTNVLRLEACILGADDLQASLGLKRQQGTGTSARLLQGRRFCLGKGNMHVASSGSQQGRQAGAAQVHAAAGEPCNGCCVLPHGLACRRHVVCTPLGGAARASLWAAAHRPSLCEATPLAAGAAEACRLPTAAAACMQLLLHAPCLSNTASSFSYSLNNPHPLKSRSTIKTATGCRRRRWRGVPSAWRASRSSTPPRLRRCRQVDLRVWCVRGACCG